jgi:hypothetical protein
VTRLSYVVPADGWDVVAELAEALERQTLAAEIELVLVAQRPFEAPRSRGITVRVVVAPGGGAHARATGVRASRGEIVALGETHVLPEPEWAGECLAAHERGADVVLPLVQNANPATALSWAGFLMDYGRYAGAATPSTIVPAYNATVRRSVLLALPRLEEVLAPGPAFDAALHRHGAKVVPAPGAVLAHLNVDRPVHWVRERLFAGALLGRSRRPRFGLSRRIAYVLSFPLIAALLFARASRAPRRGAPPATVPVIALGCVLYAVGEVWGYAGPPGVRAERQMLAYEIHKRRYTRSRA